MSHDPVSANGEAMPAADIPCITPQAGAVALACVALHRHRVALDNLRYRAEAEVVEYARARKDMEILISRLIERLDEADGDPDLEPYIGHVTAGFVDEAEIEHEGDDDPDAEPMLGARENHPSVYGHGRTFDGSQLGWATCTSAGGDELEEENEHGDTSDEEPSLGAPEVGDGYGSANRFGSRRWSDGFDQTHWSAGTGQDLELDPAEAGVADHDALHIEEQEHSVWQARGFDGTGVAIARAQLGPLWKPTPDYQSGLVRVGNAWLPR